MGEMLGLAALGAGQGAVNSASNYFTMKEQARIQRKLQQEQNDWQSGENATDRAWQEATWLDHFLKENDEYANRLGLQQNQWQNQFDITNAYNAPSAQMARLKAAGVNPSAMLAGGSSLASFGQSSASPSSSSSVAAPSGTAFSSHGVSPAPIASFGGLSSAAASFSSVAQLADSIGKLRQVGLNTKRQEAILPHEVENVANEAELKRQQALLAEIEKNVSSAWSDKKASAECQKLVSDSYAAFTQGDLNKANELLSAAQEKLTSVNAEINEQQAPQLMANLKALHDVYSSEKEKNYAQSAASYASAAQSFSYADYNEQLSLTENALREHKVTYQVLSNAILRTENQLRKRENVRDVLTNEWKVWKVLKECQREGYATAEQLERWKTAVKDNSSYEMRMVLQEINSAMPSVVLPVK